MRDKAMNDNVVTWFDPPVLDLARAKQFYGEVLGARFKDEEMNGLQMAIFEAAAGAASGMLVLSECYQPNASGAVIYFNGGEDLSQPLARAEQLGAQVVAPKTAIKEGACGYFALFIDSEGNRVGLYSPH